MGERFITADLEGTKGRSTDEPFPSWFAAQEYACRHGLKLVCAGTRAFAKRQRTLPPGAFEVHTYRSKKGIKTCGMFSPQFEHVEFLVKQGIVEVDGNGVVRVLNEKAFERHGGLTGYARRQAVIIEEYRRRSR
jgi:hypothetical protein